MDNLKKLLSRLFSRQKKAKADLPFLHEAIDLKSYPVSDVLRWQMSAKWTEMQRLIQNAYRDKLITGRSATPEVSILESSHANGWLLHCPHLSYDHQDYQHLAYLLHTLIKKEGYTVNLSERRSQSRGHAIESLTKYYLKPSLRNLVSTETRYGQPIALQLYGNITIEYITIDERPYAFKFMANAYQDSKFADPLPFDDLISILFPS